MSPDCALAPSEPEIRTGGIPLQRFHATRQSRGSYRPAVIAHFIAQLSAAACILASATAAHSEWRYCYAADPDRHRFYVSLSFIATQPMKAIEDAFARMLDERRIERRIAACPPARTKDDVDDMVEQATSYNRRNRNVVVPLDWAPADLTASPMKHTTVP